MNLPQQYMEMVNTLFTTPTFERYFTLAFSIKEEQDVVGRGRPRHKYLASLIEEASTTIATLYLKPSDPVLLAEFQRLHNLFTIERDNLRALGWL